MEPLAGIMVGSIYKTVWWGAPGPTTSHLVSGNKNSTTSLPFTYTHRVQTSCSPKRARRDFNQGREDPLESEKKPSVGAEEPEQAERAWQELWRRIYLSTSSTGTALTDKAWEWPLSAEGHQVAPCSQKLPGFWAPAPKHGWYSWIQPLSPTSARRPSSVRAQEVHRDFPPLLWGPRRRGIKRAMERNWSLKPPSLPTWGGTGEKK